MSQRRILILSATASAINIIKSLREQSDVRLFVSDVNRYAGGLYEEGVTPVLLPRARDSGAYRAALDRVIEEHEIDILIPTSDHDMEGVLRLLNDGWEPTVSMFRPSYSAHQLLSNKLRLARHLVQSGLPAPRSWDQIEDAHYPAVVKPVREGGGKGVTIVYNRAEAEAAINESVLRFGSEYLIQEYIPGGTGSTYMALLLYDNTGTQVYNTVMRSSLTYYTWGAGGNAGSIVEDLEIQELAPTIVSSGGGWRGPICVEFRKHSETGKSYVIEVNCRLNGYSYLTTMNGLNYPRAMLAILSGEALPGAAFSGPRCNFVLGFREKPVEAWVSDG